MGIIMSISIFYRSIHPNVSCWQRNSLELQPRKTFFFFLGGGGGLYWNQRVCQSVCVQILVILCRELLLKFCFNIIKTLHIRRSYIEVFQGTILKCQLLLVEELSPLELRFFLIKLGVLSHIQ